MNLKQKLSITAAVVLPSIALCVYLLLAPPNARAFGCPPGQVFDPCQFYPNAPFGCDEGIGAQCEPIGRNFVAFGPCGADASAYCASNGCVICK
jgi:hypothetical protein